MTTSRTLSPAQNLAVIVVSPLAWLTITLLPYEVSALATGHAMGASIAGAVTAAELLALAITVVAVNSRIAAMDKRRLAQVGIIVAVLSSLGSIWLEASVTLIAMRIAFGIGSGLIAASLNSLPVFAKRPESTIAWMQIAIAVNFGASIYGVGAVLDRFGADSVFIVELGLLLVVGIGSLALPKGLPVRSDEGLITPLYARAVPRLPAGAMRLLVSLGAMYLSQAACWAYAEQAGTSVGIGAVDLANLLTIAAFTTPIGGLAAVLMRDRWGYLLPLAIGFGVQMLVAVTTYMSQSQTAYISGIMVFNMTTPFTTAYLMSLLSEVDETGRSASLGGSAINFGAASGPALAAVLVIMPGRAPIGILCVIGLLGGLALAFSALRVLNRPTSLGAK
jgi:hypothetical protein